MTPAVVCDPPSPRRRSATAAALAALALGALGALGAAGIRPAPAAAAAAGAARRSSHGPATDLAALAKLQDFAYTSAVGTGTAGIVMSGRAHSRTDFEIDSFIGGSHHPARTIVVGATSYEVLGSLTEVVPEPKSYWATNGEEAAAAQWVDLLRSYGVALRQRGRCAVAKVPGTTYTETTPPANGIVRIAQQACVADRGGELLSFEEAVGGTALAQLSGGHLSHLSDSFAVTAVGGVPFIPAPKVSPLPH